MTKSVVGIQGVLGTYLTANNTSRQGSSEPEQTFQPVAKTNSRKTTTTQPISARRGRPPGKAGQVSNPKEKATLRINARLMAEYREWSWEERCQLGELVERALADYRRRHSPNARPV